MRKTRKKSKNTENSKNLKNELFILPLDETAIDELSSFNCASEELNDFLKTNAWIDQNNLINRTRLCYLNGNLAGFFSLATDTIETKSVIDGIDIENIQLSKSQ